MMAELEQIQHEDREKALVYPRSIIVAHLDLKYPLQHKWWVEGDKVRGALDDKGPAAIVFAELPYLKSRVFFTNDEETAQKDALKIGRWIKKNYPPPRKEMWDDAEQWWLPTVIVCEVTEEGNDPGAEADITIENLCFVDANRIRKALNKYIPAIKYRIIERGGWDETYRLAELHLKGFSLNMPIYEDYHSYKGWTTKDRIHAFRKALLVLDNEFSQK